MRPLKRRSVYTTLRRFHYDPEIMHVAEFLKDRFYLVTFKKKTNRLDTQHFHFFSIDDLLFYRGFYSDFGPLNLGMLYRYCLMIVSKLNSKELDQKVIIHYTSMDPYKRANAAYLAAAFSVIYLNLQPRAAWAILRSPSQSSSANQTPSKLEFLSFRDAQPFTTKETIENTISIYDCLKAMDAAFYYNLVNFSDFTLIHYEAFQVNGYSLVNWIVPNKLVALCNPSKLPFSPINIYRIIRYFTHHNIGIIVRLNEETYNPIRFFEAGIKFIDMYFDDGTAPSTEIIYQFLDLVETTNKAVAVHCRAGLGRTGTLIAAYLMKHYRMTSKEAVAWLRICRPGSVISYQQAWLDGLQPILWDSGDSFRLKHAGFQFQFKRHTQGIYSRKQWLKGGVQEKGY